MLQMRWYELAAHVCAVREVDQGVMLQMYRRGILADVITWNSCIASTRALEMRLPYLLPWAGRVTQKCAVRGWKASVLGTWAITDSTVLIWGDEPTSWFVSIHFLQSMANLGIRPSLPSFDTAASTLFAQLVLHIIASSAGAFVADIKVAKT